MIIIIIFRATMTEIQKICMLGSARILRKVLSVWTEWLTWVTDALGAWFAPGWSMHKKNTSKDCDKRDNNNIGEIFWGELWKLFLSKCCISSLIFGIFLRDMEEKSFFSEEGKNKMGYRYFWGLDCVSMFDVFFLRGGGGGGGKTIVPSI